MPAKKVLDTSTEAKKSSSRARKPKSAAENDASQQIISCDEEPQPVTVEPITPAPAPAPVTETVKKTSSRAKKTQASIPAPAPQINVTDVESDNDMTATTAAATSETAQDSKKKGRKPRGGKIVTKPAITPPAQPHLTNVVLNLKCSMQDLKEYTAKLNNMIINPLEYNSAAPPEVKYYDGSQPFAMLESTSYSTEQHRNSGGSRNIHSEKLADELLTLHSNGNTDSYISGSVSINVGQSSSGSTTANPASSLFGLQKWSQPQSQLKQHNQSDTENVSYMCSSCSCVGPASEFGLNESSQPHIRKIVGDVDLEEKEDVNVKDMTAKLKQLKVQLYKNAIQSEKKSACFWCTYDFDNTPCYIPKYEMDGVIYGYGSFCRPECAVAYLMKESIDDSTKFDRYHLLNQIYSKVYDCKKNIKPAPNPHYLLDKFYGNLSIQEYRKLLKTEHLLLVIDKPLTRILPELHEDTDEAFTKLYGIKSAPSSNASGVYKVKRQSEQPNGPSKASIIRNAFGLPS